LPKATCIASPSENPEGNCSTVYKLAHLGKIPAQKAGWHWRFHRATLVNWVAGKDHPDEKNVILMVIFIMDREPPILSITQHVKVTNTRIRLNTRKIVLLYDRVTLEVRLRSHLENHDATEVHYTAGFC
jgi:hypothetical protein